MRRSLLFTAVLALAIGLSAVAHFRQYQAFLDTPLTITDRTVLEVPRGASMGLVVLRLESAGLTQRDWRWRLFNRLNPVTIRAGEYALLPGIRPAELLEMLSAGRVVTHAFTVVEGWTFARLKAELSRDAVLVHALEAAGSDADLMAELGSEGMHPEGWFLPETYHFVRGDSDLDILKRAHAAMKSALDAAWSGRSDGPLKSAYELLILASIVEKETGIPAERAQVAGVFTRRLQQGWRLETDPTVIYGLGDAYDGDIRKRDLRTDTPYNTYTRHGLPPTPIALPGRDALQAAAQPASGTAMFFVADGRGGHVFSDTLQEHNVAVQNMLKGN